MKKFFFSLFIAFTVFLTAFAQEESEHLTFKGVPIDGTLNEYVSKMKQAGFTHIGTQDDIAILQGDFAGFKGCTVFVSTLKSIDKVSTIGVMFPEKNDWDSLENNYGNLKSMLTKKYGEPSDCTETFKWHTPSMNLAKLSSLKMGDCTWYTTFSTPKGDIQLSLESLEYNCHVILRYYDKINTDAVESQAMDDL